MWFGYGNFLVVRMTCSVHKHFFCSIVVRVSFNETEYMVLEGDLAEVCLLLDGELARNIEIMFSTEDNTATGNCIM